MCEVAILLSREPTDLYRFTFEPALAALTRSRHSRMYTDKSAVDVVKDVLGRAGLTSSSDFRVQGSYAPEEHVCQYKESDLAFISRWLEREGIAYWFEHGDSEEKCVFTDDPSAHEPLDPTPVRYRPTSGEDASRGESFHRFTATAVARPASVKLVDNDYMKPDLDVSSSSNVVPTSASVVIEHGNRTFTPSEASRVAKLRAAELFAGASVYRGEGAVFHLRPGYVFELSEHPRDAMNQKYLVTSIEHVCNLRAHAPELAAITGLTRRESYGASVTAIPASVPFRPPRATPRPRISGFEAAVVDGPATSDYAQLDDQGRYKVKFHFDESDLSRGKGTTWLRMVQPHAGNPEGFHFPLRSGTEVFVAFVGGDPDRPIIAGAVHNAETPNPVTSANNTKNVVQTGGNTRIEIEDQDGSQYSHISTPTQSTYLHAGAHAGGGSHNVCEVSSGNCLFDIGTNLDIQVDAKLTETVTGDVTETYTSCQTSTDTGPQTSTTGGRVVETYTAKQTTEVGGTVTETYDAPHMSIVSGGLRDETFMGGQTTGVTGPTVELYGGTHGTSVGGATKQAYIGPLTTVVSGARTSQHVSGAVTLVQGPTVAILASLNIDVQAPSLRHLHIELERDHEPVVHRGVVDGLLERPHDEHHLRARPLRGQGGGRRRRDRGQHPQSGGDRAHDGGIRGQYRRLGHEVHRSACGERLPPIHPQVLKRWQTTSSSSAPTRSRVTSRSSASAASRRCRRRTRSRSSSRSPRPTCPSRPTSSERRRSSASTPATGAKPVTCTAWSARSRSSSKPKAARSCASSSCRASGGSGSASTAASSPTWLRPTSGSRCSRAEASRRTTTSSA